MIFEVFLQLCENSYLITPGELRVIGAGSRWRTVHRWARCWGRHRWKHSSRADIVKFCKTFNSLKKNDEAYLAESEQSPLKAARWSRSFRRLVGKYSDRWKVTCQNARMISVWYWKEETQINCGKWRFRLKKELDGFDTVILVQDFFQKKNLRNLANENPLLRAFTDGNISGSWGFWRLAFSGHKKTRNSNKSGGRAIV